MYEINAETAEHAAINKLQQGALAATEVCLDKLVKAGEIADTALFVTGLGGLVKKYGVEKEVEIAAKQLVKHEIMDEIVSTISHVTGVDEETVRLTLGAAKRKTCQAPMLGATKRTKSETLRKQWEEAFGTTWPIDPDTGKPQDVVHDIAIADGGPEKDVNNYGPKTHEEHIQEHKDRGDFSRWAKRRGKKK